MVLLLGEAGVGKTRLVSEIMTMARRSGAFLLQSSSSSGPMTPFGFFTAAIEDYIAGMRPGPPSQASYLQDKLRSSVHGMSPPLRRLFPMLDELIGTAPDSDDEEQGFLHDEVAKLILKIIGSHSMGMLVLDNIHLMDDSSLAVVESIAGQLKSHKVLLVATARVPSEPSRVRRFVDAFGRDMLRKISLPNLSYWAGDSRIR